MTDPETIWELLLEIRGMIQGLIQSLASPVRHPSGSEVRGDIEVGFYWVRYNAAWRLARWDGEDWEVLLWSATVPRGGVLIGPPIINAPMDGSDEAHERTTPPNPQAASIQSQEDSLGSTVRHHSGSEVRGGGPCRDWTDCERETLSDFKEYVWQYFPHVYQTTLKNLAAWGPDRGWTTHPNPQAAPIQEPNVFKNAELWDKIKGKD